MIALDSHPTSSRLAGELASRTKPNADDPKTFLAYLRQRMGLAGITRVSEISWLSPAGIHVYQATRPLLHSHIFFGQNCGSQGKGLTPITAEISAIMEGIENFCAEPRNPWLVRGSYEFLSLSQPVIAPKRFSARTTAEVSESEPLMWTFAHSLSSGEELLVPAELVYFPFFPRDYETQSRFLSNSTGLAAARTLVQASVHGLYEVLERHFRAGLECAPPLLHVERLTAESVLKLEIFRRIRTLHPDFSVCVLALSPVVGTHIKTDLSMVVCLLIEESGAFFPGYGCRSSPRAALDQAAIEAMQCVVTVWSGAREDGAIRQLALQEQEHTGVVPLQRLSPDQLPPETLSLAEFDGRTRSPARHSPHAELAFLQDYAQQLGLGEILIKDLTPIGLDVPAVRVLVPGSAHPGAELGRPNPHGYAEVRTCQYAMDL